LTDMLGNMIAAGRIERLPARTPWPLHAALLHLHEEAGRLGLRTLLAFDLVFVPSPEVGRAALGADAAVRALVRAGFLHEVGVGLGAQLQVDDAAVVRGRRQLMRLDPRVVALLQRAGERWAALASTCSKYADSARRSPEARVASGAA